MRRLAALIIGVATAQPDIDAACRRRTYPDRYVVINGAKYMFQGASKFKQDLGWCLDDSVNTNDAFLRTKCEKTSCGVEGPPCQAPAEIVPAPTYRPTYKPSLRGSDDDDCVDDEDWSYTTKEGDVYKCDHVAKKPEKRCGRVGNDGVVASEACPKTCGTC